MSEPDISVIIPQRGHLHTLRRLVESIPESDRVEVIVVDNQEQPITREDLRKAGVRESVALQHADYKRFAGGGEMLEWIVREGVGCCSLMPTTISPRVR
ncbi:MAG: glycosyltransferase [Bacteroidales bacterium]|nr:glycosyltransferase [Bacteroidales bacterium]